MSRIAMFTTAAGAALVLAAGTSTLAWQGQTGSPQTGMQSKPKADSGQMAHRDEDFVKDVAQSDRVEVEASKLAATKATNADVRAFADKLVKEHTNAGADLKSMVDSMHVVLAEDDPGLKLKRQKHESLQKLTGAAFDKEYLEDMISDHEAALEMFGKETTFGKNAALKAWADKTKPTLMEHLKQARDLRAKLFK